MSPPDNIPLFHITHGKNLESIIEQGQLLCCNALAELDVTSIAYEGIQNRRQSWQVPCGPGGVLHDYVPFYFAPRSPMLYAIHTGQVDGANSQRGIVHLVTSVDEMQNHGCEFVFTDGHPIIHFSEFFDELSQLPGEVDWNVMGNKWWNDTDDDPDRKRRRQAEFLIYRNVPWTSINGIGVSDKRVAERVREIIADAGHQPAVKPRTDWYY